MNDVPGVIATRFEPPGEPVGTAIVVPGRGYPPAAPLTFFAGFALLQHGWSVRQVWWDPPAYESDEQTTAWVRGQVEAQLPDSGRVVLVAKSLGTYAAPLAAERGLAAVWLTPLLQVPSLRRRDRREPGAPAARRRHRRRHRLGPSRRPRPRGPRLRRARGARAPTTP